MRSAPSYRTTNSISPGCSPANQHNTPVTIRTRWGRRRRAKQADQVLYPPVPLSNWGPGNSTHTCCMYSTRDLFYTPLSQLAIDTGKYYNHGRISRSAAPRDHNKSAKSSPQTKTGFLIFALHSKPTTFTFACSQQQHAGQVYV